MAELEEYYDGDEPQDSAVEKQVAPGLKIIPKPEKDGQTEPVLLVALEPEEGLLERIAAAGYKKPCYLVTVTAIREKSLYDTDAVEREYIAGKTYIFPMKKRQTQYVAFNRPGLNRITACIVDIRDFDDVRRAHMLESGRHSATSWYDGALQTNGLKRTAESRIEINLDGNIFAPEPTGWRRAIVDHVFKGRPFDECKFRGRVLASLLAEIPIQLAGLVLRPLFLLLLWTMLAYDIPYNQLWSLRIRSIWENSGESAWFESRNGTLRSRQPGLWQILPWINPAAIAGYAAIFFAVPAVVFGIVNLPWNDKVPKGHQQLASWGYQDTIWITWKWVAVVAIAVLIAVAMLAVSRAVTNTVSKKQRQRASVSASSSRRVASSKEREMRAQEQLDKLRQATVAIPIKGAVPQSAMRGLWFQSLKRKVCRPYAVK